MNLENIKSSIILNNYSHAELSSIAESLKIARDRLGSKVKSELEIGDNVNFTSSKTGKNVTGVVMKISPKYITVRTLEGLWKVPAAMLTRIAD
jgi:ssDNA-binding replication factor A large subunit